MYTYIFNNYFFLTALAKLKCTGIKEKISFIPDGFTSELISSAIICDELTHHCASARGHEAVGT